MDLLTLITFLPLAVGLLLLVTGARLPDQAWRWAGLVATVATFLLSLGLWQGFDPAQGGYQFVRHVPWLPAWGIHWFVGIDGMSLLLVLLTTFLMPLVLLGSWNDVQRAVKPFVFFNLALETGMLGAFVSLNLFQFYVFWEVMLIPMYFIIGIWGGPRRVYAAVKFFLFTMAGSLPMLVAILALYVVHAGQFGAYTFDLITPPGGTAPGLLATLVPVAAGEGVPWWQTQPWLFAAFALAFAVKVPVVPLHTWLPDAHVEAPTAGSVVLAGVLLKMGTYGFIRFAIPLFPDAAVQAQTLFLVLAVIGIIYGALVAMVQTDIKKLVAYSSVSHLAYVMLGLFSFNLLGSAGALYQMLGHGLSTGALFLLVGMIYERRHTRDIAEFGGLATGMPFYTFAFLVVTLSSIGLPGLNGFVGEFLVLLGAFGENRWVGALATSGVILGAVYMLWLVRRFLFGPLTNQENAGLPDLSAREWLVLAPLLVMIVVMGVAPRPFLSRMEPSLEAALAPLATARAAAQSRDHERDFGQILPGVLEDAVVEDAALEGGVAR